MGTSRFPHGRAANGGAARLFARGAPGSLSQPVVSVALDASSRPDRVRAPGSGGARGAGGRGEGRRPAGPRDGRGAVELLGPRRCAATTRASASAARPGSSTCASSRSTASPSCSVRPFLAEPDRVPLTPEARLDATRVALAEAPGVFAPVAGHPSTVRALAARSRTSGSRTTPRSTGSWRPSPRAASVVDCYRRFRTLTAGTYDDEDQLEAAATLVATGGVPADVGALLLFCPERLTPGGLGLVAAFARPRVHRGRARPHRRPGRGRVGPGPGCTPGTHLGEPQDSGPATVDHGDQVISAPGPGERSARGRARVGRAGRRRGHASTTSRSSWRVDEPHARLLHERLGEAGIPVYGPSTRRARRHGHRPHPDRAARRDRARLPPRRRRGAPRRRADPRGRRRRLDPDGPLGPDLTATRASISGAAQWRERLARRRDEILERAGDVDPEWLETRSGGRGPAGPVRRRAHHPHRRVVLHLGRVVHVGRGARRPLPRTAAVVMARGRGQRARPRARPPRRARCADDDGPRRPGDVPHRARGGAGADRRSRRPLRHRGPARPAAGAAGHRLRHGVRGRRVRGSVAASTPRRSAPPRPRARGHRWAGRARAAVAGARARRLPGGARGGTGLRHLELVTRGSGRPARAAPLAVDRRDGARARTGRAVTARQLAEAAPGAIPGVLVVESFAAAIARDTAPASPSASSSSRPSSAERAHGGDAAQHASRHRESHGSPAACGRLGRAPSPGSPSTTASSARGPGCCPTPTGRCRRRASSRGPSARSATSSRTSCASGPGTRPRRSTRSTPATRGSLVHKVLEDFVQEMPPRTSPDQRWSRIRNGREPARSPKGSAMRPRPRARPVGPCSGRSNGPGSSGRCRAPSTPTSASEPSAASSRSPPRSTSGAKPRTRCRP